MCTDIPFCIPCCSASSLYLHLTAQNAVHKCVATCRYMPIRNAPRTDGQSHGINIRFEQPSGLQKFVSSYSFVIMVTFGFVVAGSILYALYYIFAAFGWLRGKRRDARAELIEEMSKNIASAYNVEGGSNQRSGVRFDDVQARLSLTFVACAQAHACLAGNVTCGVRVAVDVHICR